MVNDTDNVKSSKGHTVEVKGALLKKVIMKIAYGVAVFFSVLSLYFGLEPQATMVPPVMHLMLSITLVLLTQIPIGEKKSLKNILIGVLDLVFLVSAIYASLYIIINYTAIAFSVGAFDQKTLLVGALIILSVLYGTIRLIGWPLPLIAMFFLFYAYFGRQFPGLFQHGGYPLERIIGHIFFTEDGIYGIPLRTSANLVIFFLIFSSFYEKTKGGDFVIDLANASVGFLRGGAAKVAVVASGFFGSISGAATSNVVGTGAITIPLMKRLGYQPHFAGAVEAVASTGGQIMPPIMGTAAFIMAEMLGVRYVEVVKTAIVPAFLYFFAVFIVVHLEALRLDIKGIDRSELPPITGVFIKSGHMAIPLLVLVYLLIILQWSPGRSAIFGTFAAIIVCFLREHTRLDFRTFFDSLNLGAMRVLQVALACGCAGIVVGVFALTGLGLKLSHILIELSGGQLHWLLMLTAITSIILGMGMPTVGAYLVLAILIAPTLIRMGVDPIAAHLFVFYFGNMSMVTPPVCLAAFAAAGIAGSNANKTAWTATRLAITAFILPFMFVYGSGLILQGTTSEIIITIATSMLGITFLAAGLQRYLFCNLKIYESVFFVAVAIKLIQPALLTDSIGLALGAIVVFYNYQRFKRLKKAKTLGSEVKA